MRITTTLSKRDAILDAALDLFAERTFASTPMPVLAEHAGVGAGTIYRYFDSKDALVNALYRRWKTEMTDVVSGDIPQGLTPREEFGHWWLGLWTFATENPAAFLFLETHHHAAYLDDSSLDIGTELTARAVAYVRRGQRLGAIRSGRPEMLIALVLGGVHRSVQDRDRQRLATHPGHARCVRGGRVVVARSLNHPQEGASPMANVLITGCSSGFGLLAALEFARRGDTVFASMRTVSKSGALEQAAAAEGLKVKVIALDVTDDASVRAGVDAVVAEAGTIDVLVNNAGIEMNGAIHLISDDEARWQLDTNVLGPLRTMRAVVPIMLQQGGGTIVNVSSVAGVVAVPYGGMYSASKHTLEAMTEAMHYELAHRNIRLALIEPGQFTTEFANNSQMAAGMAADADATQRRERLRASMGGLLPAGPPPDPQAVANAIVDAAQARAPKLRVPVGADAELVTAARSSMDFESFEQAMRQTLNWFD